MLIISWFIHCPTQFIPVNSVAIELHVIVNITLVCKLELRYRKETFKYYVPVNSFFTGDHTFYIFQNILIEKILQTWVKELIR